ncbi:MAG: inner membrane CreD family protein, partial [Lentisphaeraceae bacterium]|nr:inner membrane CreD family protein [Lentisphaeraceae bacterium]
TGQNSEINLASSWKDPSFYGAFLPSERKVNKDGSGFSAKWQINDLQRGFRQQWKDGENRGEVVDCGVKLIQVTDVYKQVNRVVKYAVLFLCFTFAAIFISERITRRKLHPIQYLLVGFASLMFYVLLLSFSEQMDFNKAYILTAALTTLLLTTYAKGLFGEWKTSMVIGGVCTGLYSFLFGTIQLEDYALMMGSSGLFVILALVMFLTRKLNVQEEPLPG